MTQEQKELVKTYFMKEVSKFITENQDRIQKEIEQKYGISFENIKDTTHDSNAPTSTSPDTEFNPETDGAPASAHDD